MDIKLPDNIGVVEPPLAGQDPQVKDDTLRVLSEVAEGVSHFLNATVTGRVLERVKLQRN